MNVLLVHPSGLMYSEVYLRLEPLGLECVAQAVREAGHRVELLDLQIFKAMRTCSRRCPADCGPTPVGFSVNYLANIPEVLELSEQIKREHPSCFIFAGGHSVSFVAEEVLAHGAGNLNCIVMGEGERVVPAMLEKIPNVDGIAGLATPAGVGPRQTLGSDLNPDSAGLARPDQAAAEIFYRGAGSVRISIEFTRGCPWDCSFCSAWTFYGRSYRQGGAGVDRGGDGGDSGAEPVYRG